MAVKVIKRVNDKEFFNITDDCPIAIEELLNIVNNGENLKIIDASTEDDVTEEMISKLTSQKSESSDGYANNVVPSEEDNSEFVSAAQVVPEEFKNLRQDLESVEGFTDKKVNFVDLFCGAGGLTCGLKMVGLNCLLGVDIDEDSIKTFSYNHKDAETFCGSISDLTEELLLSKIGGQKVHLLAGGPPFQSFSPAGKSEQENKNNFLFSEYTRILKILDPDFILFENITGLVAKKNEKMLEELLAKFTDFGYTVRVKMMESQHYGVPQKRKRTIFIGSKIGKEVNFPLPIFEMKREDGYYVRSVSLGDVLCDLKTQDGEIHNHDLKYTVPTVKKNIERLKLIPEGRGIRYKKDEDELLPEHLKLGIDWENIREKRLRELRLHRLDRRKPVPTVNTQSRQFYHPLELRRFTARELAKFQSFPNDFIFFGTNSSQIRQIGNALPPLMAKVLAKEIIKHY